MAGNHRYILVIEDDVATREAMGLLLEMAGHCVACAGNGREALDYLSTHKKPQLILLDLMMPVMDGWQFRRRQQQEPALASIPVVVVSADSGVEDKARDLGAADYLQKPVDVEALVVTVRRHLGPAGEPPSRPFDRAPEGERDR